MKAEPQPTNDVNRASGTDSDNGCWLRRLVRRHGWIANHLIPNLRFRLFQCAVDFAASRRVEWNKILAAAFRAALGAGAYHPDAINHPRQKTTNKKNDRNNCAALSCQFWLDNFMATCANAKSVHI